MTKKHFEAFAKEIFDLVCVAKVCEPKDREHKLTLAIAEYKLVRDVALKFNPNFSSSRFRNACGLGDEQFEP